MGLWNSGRSILKRRDRFKKLFTVNLTHAWFAEAPIAAKKLVAFKQQGKRVLQVCQASLTPKRFVSWCDVCEDMRVRFPSALPEFATVV